jgi:predicted Rossmann-fold nucleotide-binding protein
VFISGSHAESDLAEFLEELGAELVGRGFSIVSGAGLDGGDIVVRGAISGIARCPTPLETPIEIYPFWSRGPTAAATVELQRDRKNHIRQQIIRTCALCIFVSGRDGTYDEYGIATELRRVVIPVGFTGGSAARIATELLARPDVDDAVRDLVQEFSLPPRDPRAAAQAIVERLSRISEDL